MKTQRYFAQLEAIYKQVPSMTCPNCQDCCICAVVCSALEYQYIKVYIKVNFSLEQRHLFDKRIKANRSIEMLCRNKYGVVKCLPCIFMDRENKKRLIYPARTFICRTGGLNSLRGSCGNIKIIKGRDLDLNSVKKLSRYIKDLSKQFISENGASSRNYDFLRNWLYVEKLGEDCRMPLGDPKNLDVEKILDGRSRFGDGKQVCDVDFTHFF